MINLDASAKSAIYPGVEAEICRALRLHNVAAPHFSGAAAAAAHAEYRSRIAAVLGCDPDQVCAAESCTDLYRRLSTTLRWTTADFEHSSNRRFAVAITDPQQAQFLSEYNHESGASIAANYSPAYIDATGSELQMLGKITVFSLAKHGGGPGGVMIDRTGNVAPDWGSGGIMVLAAAAAALEYAKSEDGRRRAAALPDIRRSFAEFATKHGWTVCPGDSSRVLLVITDVPTELWISAGESEQLLLSGGAACNSGTPIRNTWAATHYGADAANRCLRLSWDLSMSAHTAAEAQRKLETVYAQLRSASSWSS